MEENEPDPIDALPPGVALAWGLQAPATRGPKPGLSLDRIVATAIDLADAGGSLSAVSMNKLADALGFTTMSLYRYVRAKDDLVVLMGEAAMGRPPAPDPDHTWREALERWARSILTMYRRHAWVFEVPITGMPMLPNQLAWLDNALQGMATTGLSYQEQLSTALLVDGYVRSWAQLSQGIGQMGNGPADGTTGDQPSPGDMMRVLIDPVRFPALAPMVAAGEFDDDEEDIETIFDFGLDRVLDGIEALVTARRAAAPPKKKRKKG